MDNYQRNIILNPISEETNGELSDLIHYECQFCEITMGLLPTQRSLCEKLSGEQFYCSFCLQNQFNTKNNRNILIMSFRGIIGFYYETLYLAGKKLYYSQIEDYINSHQETGILNPVFKYDPESFLWFVDFNRVGKGRKRIPLNDVLKTTINILTCFNLTENIDHIKTSKVYEKYKEALEKFHEQRYRPENRKILSPTLVGCGGVTENKQIDQESMRNFIKEDFVLKQY